MFMPFKRNTVGRKAEGKWMAFGNDPVKW